MAPLGTVRKPTSSDGLVLEAWSQGFLVGGMVMLMAITIANMRRGVLLHKLILLELVFGCLHGTFILTDPPTYGKYLSATALLLNVSWVLHNVIAWLKTRPFLTRIWSRVYIGTVMLSTPYWVVEIYANVTYFNNINDIFLSTRPYEAIFRDPWWVISIIILFYQIRSRYSLSLHNIFLLQPRFTVLLVSMFFSLVFVLLDILSVTGALSRSTTPDGLNPWWKLSTVFKCLTDTVILDDFKTALDRLHHHKLMRESITGPSLATDAELERVVTSTADSFAQVNGNSNHQEKPLPRPVDALRRTASPTFSTTSPVRDSMAMDHDAADLQMLRNPARSRRDTVRSKRSSLELEIAGLGGGSPVSPKRMDFGALSINETGEEDERNNTHADNNHPAGVGLKEALDMKPDT